MEIGEYRAGREKERIRSAFSRVIGAKSGIFFRANVRYYETRKSAI